MALDYTDPQPPFQWYRAAKEHGTWDPEAIDLEQDRRDWEAMFTEDEREQFMKVCSLFYEGEESVTRTLAPYPMAVGVLDSAPFDTLQEEIFLASQLWEEGKHTDFFSRYFETVFGTQDTDSGNFDEDFWNPELEAYLIDDLEEISFELMEVTRRAASAKRNGGDVGEAQREVRYTLGDAVMHYMGIVETQLAESGYVALDQMLEDKDALPGFREAMEHIRGDEARHINNGRWLMKQLAEEDPGVVPAVYESHVRRFEEEIVPPTIQNIYVPNPLGIDMVTLIDESLKYMRSTFELIGEEKFSDEFQADYTDKTDPELKERILGRIQEAA